MDFLYEHFNNIYDFEKELKDRKVNEAFGFYLGSEAKDYCWFQTESYDDAEKLMMNGWNVKIDEIKREIEKFSLNLKRTKNKQIKSIAGFAPCVPNAIRGVPKSMYANKKINKNIKTKVCRLVINNTNSGSTSGEDLLKSGIAFLKTVILLESSGIKVKVDVVPKMSANRRLTKLYGCSVTIKDYNQPLNISKIAYPLANPSFFRRHGFRYFETLDKNMKEFVGNYGRSVIHIKNESIVKKYFEYAGFNNKDNIIYMDFNDCENADFNPFELLKNKNIKIA